jgi:hypothetical protein
MQSEFLAHGILAPWILELTSQTFVETKLLKCISCDFVYFSHRFSESELQKLYSDYRDDSYFKLRNKWEPWYRRNINDAYKGNSNAVDVRVEFMTKLIKSSECTTLGTVLDIGGDEGQFFPEIPMTKRIVIDPSNKPLRENVDRAKSLNEVTEEINLIIAAHILEHVNEPVAFVAELCSHLHVGGMIYIEVPLDCPKIKKSHSQISYQEYLLKLSNRTQFIRILFDFITGINRQFGREISKYGLVKQSEHINYFSKRSLDEILSKSGMTAVASNSNPDASTGGLRLGKLGILAIKQ